MGISVSAEFSGLLYTVKGGMDLLERSSFSSYDFYAIAYEKIRLPSKLLSTGDLINPSDAKTLTAQQFYPKYGDAWVNRLDMGGNLFGVIHVHTTTAEQKTQLDTRLQGSGLGASFELKMQAIHEAARDIGTVNVLFKKSGGKPAFVTETEFLQECKSFPKEVTDSGGSPVGFGLAGYEVANWPVDGKPLAKFNQFDFSTVSLATVQSQKMTLKQALTTATKKADEIASSPLTATAPESFDFTSIKFPKRTTKPPPDFPMSFGNFGCCVLLGTGNGWISASNWFDSIGMGPATGADVHFIYEAKFMNLNSIGGHFGESQPSSAGADGTRVSINGPHALVGLKVLLGGTEGGNYNVCYRFIFKGEQEKTATDPICNGNWLNAPANKIPDRIHVKLTLKS
jgi:hypothetical protein